MKIILSEMTVWWFRGSCLIAGGTILLSLSAFAGNRCRIRMDEVPAVTFCATFAILGWMMFSAYGVQQMPAGRASIVAFTMPLWATIFSAWLLAEPVSYSKVIGLGFGLAGLASLMGHDLLILKQVPLGTLFMLLAAVSWGMGTVILKRGKWQLPLLSNIAWQLLFSAIPILFVAVLLEPFPSVNQFSNDVILALIYIYLFPMSFCQWAYFKVVHLLPASVAAVGTLMVPVVRVYSSHLILDEAVGLNDLAALVMILIALVLVLLLPAWRSKQAW